MELEVTVAAPLSHSEGACTDSLEHAFRNHRQLHHGQNAAREHAARSTRAMGPARAPWVDLHRLMAGWVGGVTGRAAPPGGGPGHGGVTRPRLARRRHLVLARPNGLQIAHVCR